MYVLDMLPRMRRGEKNKKGPIITILVPTSEAVIYLKQELIKYVYHVLRILLYTGTYFNNQSIASFFPSQINTPAFLSVILSVKLHIKARLLRAGKAEGQPD